ASEPIIRTLRTGLALFDETNGGLTRGEIVGIIAGPGVGKSMMVDSTALSVLKVNESATARIYALETSKEVRSARLIGSSAVQIDKNNRIERCVPLKALLHGELRAAGAKLAQEVAARLEREFGARLTFVDSLVSADEIAVDVIEHRPDLVVLDHLG